MKFRLGVAIAIERPEKPSDHDLEMIMNIWNRKPCRVSILKYMYMLYTLAL